MFESGSDYYPASDQFSRQQVQVRTGVSDDVLAFWIKQGLLVPLPGPPRAHRRFSYEQLHIAVVLNSMRTLGANVGVLRIFAQALQDGVAIYRGSSFSDDDLRAASRLRWMIEKFDAGEVVKIYDPAVPREDELEAKGIADVVRSWKRGEELDGSADALTRFGQSLLPSQARSLEYALTLVSPFHLMSPDSGVKWIAWIDESGAPRFAHSDEVILERDGGPTAAFFIPLSRLVIRLWPERIERAHRVYERGRSIRLAKHAIHLQATNSDEATRVRLQHNLPEDCRTYIAQLEEEAAMDG